ncbi:hypothetical protein NGRA_1143 [Nosema granulosis]|uniref:Uncharacterized protein n=1 Tax=Nosema granulosis TaxID=83296 RepID=A0A9P6H2A0_9MICR|nr:hypothetical protein NGRA_1143 [Nosema granulosis]
MDNHEVKRDLSYFDIINEDIEKKLKRAETYKKFITYINNHEEYLDSVYVPPTTPEEQKRRKKSTTVAYVESIKLDDDEIVKDLISISKDPTANVRVLDNVLYIKNNKFVRGDKVIIKGENEEYMATVTAVEEGELAVKSKENKRIRINLEEFKKNNFSITRINKQK